MPYKPVAPLSKTCPTCGNDFTTPFPQRTFCSTECRPRTTLARTIQCGFCGEPFKPAHHKIRCCSKACARRLEAKERRDGLREQLPQWKGGRFETTDGYVSVWVGVGYPGALSNGYMPEHRKVMADHLGRPLRKDESVHHINGNRQDNRLENLQLRTRFHGKGAAMVCADCGSSNVVHAKLKG